MLLNRDTAVREALALLNEVGLDGVSTRELAKRLGVEQPALYWHFKNKDALLEAMAKSVMEVHATRPLPSQDKKWDKWFAENARSFRSALLHYREGARLHAGSRPSAEDAVRMEKKLDFLVKSGFHKKDALMALLAISRFALGCALEQQIDEERSLALSRNNELEGTLRTIPNHQAMFESGLALLLDGLAKRKHDSRSRRSKKA